jgi:hypothetical protein
VRVLPNARDLGSDGLTFHLFETSVPDEAIAIINHHHGDAVDRPVRFKGVAPTEVLRSRFSTEWDKARPLEAVIAERIRPRSASCQGRDSVQVSGACSCLATTSRAVGRRRTGPGPRR